jgi:hypothetical protein
MIAKHWKIRKMNSWILVSLKQTRPKPHYLFFSSSHEVTPPFNDFQQIQEQ